MDGSLRVLLVEDDVEQASLMGQRLRDFNDSFIIDTTHSGAACLEKLSETRYEAIILEYNLHEQNTLDLLSAISENGVGAPVVVVSSSDGEEAADETLRRGASDYVVKNSSFLTVLPQVVQRSIQQSRRETELKASEQKYEAIFQKASAAIMILNPDSKRILEANLKTSEVSGYENHELVGKSFVYLFPKFLRTQVEDCLRIAIDSGNHRDEGLSMLTKLGKSFPVDVDLSITDLAESKTLLCSLSNISEKRHLQTLILNSKKRLQNTFDGITDIIFQVGRNDEIVIANRKLSELHGSRPENLIGRKYYEVFYEAEAPIVDCPVQATFKSGEPNYLEYAAGETIYEISSYPIFSVDGKLESVAAYSKDVSEKRRLEKTLIQSEKLATIGLLASGIAHELRNPLNVIETARYYIDEFLVKKNSDVAAKLDIIRRNVRRSSKIINNLLEFSRHSEHDREVIDLRALVESTVSLIHKELSAKNIDYSLDCPEDTTVFFSMDCLKQVLLNLIINSIQAMKTGGKLKVAVAQKGKGWVDMMIRDTGMGIPKKNLPHLFSPFFTTKEVGEGTGLGLYITHMIVAREGGKIKVDSTIDVGTTFTITLPQRETSN